MFKRLTIAVAALAISSPVQANALKDYIYSNQVLAEVHRSGTTIKFQGERCEQGAYGSYTSGTDVMVLCLKNHSDFPELADTIRHETQHIIQMCHGGPVLTFEQVASFAKPSDYRNMHGYGTHSQHHELEAFIAAREVSDVQMVQNFKDACYEND
jgi:hypothetical protein